jgi:hypothetical protein
VQAVVIAVQIEPVPNAHEDNRQGHTSVRCLVNGGANLTVEQISYGAAQHRVGVDKLQAFCNILGCRRVRFRIKANRGDVDFLPRPIELLLITRMVTDFHRSRSRPMLALIKNQRLTANWWVAFVLLPLIFFLGKLN